MPEHDDAPDPTDAAYVEAEAMLSDPEARAARRARVLAAVAMEPAAAHFERRSDWRRGGRWLIAASVAGLAVFVAIQVYRPVPRPPIAAPPAARPPAPTPAAAGIAGAPAAHLAPPSPAAPPRQAPPPPEERAPAQAETKVPPAESRQAGLANAPAPPPVVVAQPKAFPKAEAPSPPPPPPAPPSQRDALDAQAPAGGIAERAAKPAAEAPSSETVGEMVVTAEKREAPAAQLRAAAAAGRTDQIRALLARGVPVDAPDADGNTALMISIQADQPAAAALLRGHGASLRRKNHAGQSAEDLAKAAGDAELDKAVGVNP